MCNAHHIECATLPSMQRPPSVSFHPFSPFRETEKARTKKTFKTNRKPTMFASRGPLWKPLGGLLGRLGGLLGRLGTILGVVDRSLCVSGPSWTILRASWNRFGSLLGRLEASWKRRGGGIKKGGRMLLRWAGPFLESPVFIHSVYTSRACTLDLVQYNHYKCSIFSFGPGARNGGREGGETRERGRPCRSARASTRQQVRARASAWVRAAPLSGEPPTGGVARPAETQRTKPTVTTTTTITTTTFPWLRAAASRRDKRKARAAPRRDEE